MQSPDRQRRAQSFEEIGAEYHRLRPPYPDRVVDWMLPDVVTRVLDLGAGTGKLTDGLVARGIKVVAVDPSAQMLQVLRERHPQVECHVATAEQLPLPDDSVDAVVVGQAWHWMDPARAGAEIARVLRPGGWLSMAWNQDQADEPWLQEFEAVQQVPRGQALNSQSGREPHPGPAFTPFEERSVEWRRDTTGEDFLELHKTHSAWLVADAATRASREAQWQALLDTHGRRGPVQIPYRTHVWRTQLLG